MPSLQFHILKIARVPDMSDTPLGNYSGPRSMQVGEQPLAPRSPPTHEGGTPSTQGLQNPKKYVWGGRLWLPQGSKYPNTKVSTQNQI